MRSNIEFRNLAWKRLWADHWFGRLFGGGFLLGLCGYAVQVVLSGILGRLGVQSWFEYFQAVVQNRQDLTTPIPNLTPDYISQASSSTVLTFFFSFLMAGIASYGCAVVLKKCLANDEKDWLGETFGGFKYPFGLLWLQLRYWLIYLVWWPLAWLPLAVAIGFSVLFVKHFAESNLALTVAVVTIVMSIGAGALFAVISVPFYRYRFLFLVKAEHPDWGAGECIRSCRALMEGNKMKSFRLDCSYWKPITLMLLPLLVLSLAIWINEWFYGAGRQGLEVVAIVAFLCLIAFLPLVLVVPQYIRVGQGFLYEELKHQNERNA